MWELDYKEGWESKNWCFWTVVLEKTLESPLDCKEIQWVHPKGNQSWIFIGRTDAEAPILWPPDATSWLTAKDPNAVKDWRQEAKRTTEDEMVGWHYWLDGYEFEQALRAGDGWEAWPAAVHGVTKSQTQLSELNCTQWGWEQKSYLQSYRFSFPNIFLFLALLFLTAFPSVFSCFHSILPRMYPTSPCWCVVEGTGGPA